MNAASAARLMGRPGALVRFHAFFNTGALLGAAVAGIVLHAGISWRWLWPTLALVAAALAVWTVDGRRGDAPRLPTGLAPGPRATGRYRGPLRRLRRDGLLLLVHFALAEVPRGVDTWACCTSDPLAAGVLLGRARTWSASRSPPSPGGRRSVLGRLSPRIALVVGGSIASAGILVESVSPDAVVAAWSRTRCGRRIALLALVMSDVSRVASRPTSAVGPSPGGLLRPGGRGPVGGLGLGHLRPQPGSPGPGRGGRPGRVTSLFSRPSARTPNAGASLQSAASRRSLP